MAETTPDGALLVSDVGGTLLELHGDGTLRTLVTMPHGISALVSSLDGELIAVGEYNDVGDCNTVERVTVVRRSDGARLWHVDGELLERVQNLESIVVALDEAPRTKALPGNTPGKTPGKTIDKP
jgi:hypothetical protein